MKKTRNRDMGCISALYTIAYSASRIKHLACEYGKSFEDFLQKREHVRSCAEDLKNNLYDSDALARLKNEFAIYRRCYVICKTRETSRRNKRPERIEELRALDTNSIMKLMVTAELAQYDRFFEEHPRNVRVKPGTITHRKQKKMARRIRTETLLEIYKTIYVVNDIRLKIEESLLTNPKELYPAARAMKRKFIIHSGTTNTGKTHNAIEALKRAETGVYLGPLRLLAIEIQEKLLFDEVMCNLKTGEEENIVPYATHVASTVEMADLHAIYDAAVIDECQMIGDKHRGCGWTRAILGVCAKEIHLCTAPEGVELLVKIIEDCGDEYELKEYERRAPIEYDTSLDTGAEIRWTDEDGKRRRPTCEERLAKIKTGGLQYGDALIAFSRADVLEIADILKQTGIEASIIYGALPYRTRLEQLKRFMRRETKVIVATDAIGMGLNLPIRRVIFTAVQKFDGEKFRRLLPSEIKQIAGRAGRKGLYEKGYVYSVVQDEYIYSALTCEAEPLKTAYIDFDTTFLDIESGMRDIMKAWSEAYMPFDMYEKINVSRTIALMKHIEKLCVKENLTCNKETEYRLATIAFDESCAMVISTWMDYVTEYLSGASEISYPKIKNQDIEALEGSFKRIDLYYSFCRTVGFESDADWIADAKEYITEEMNYKLLGRTEQSN